MPKELRLLLVYRACALDASRGGRDDPAFYENLEQTAAWGDGIGRIGMIPPLKKKNAMAGRGAWPAYEESDSILTQLT